MDERIHSLSSASGYSQVTGDRENNFDFLRQFAAFLVIVGHSESLVGADRSGFWGVSLSTFGIQIFLAVSGYLVTESWLKTPELMPFLQKRVRRIFPGLIVCILLTTFALGPFLTSLSRQEYFHHPGTYFYLNNLFLYPVYFLPGLFVENIYPNTVNGSLWSLPVEFACYLIVAGTGFFLTKLSPVFAVISSLLLLVVANVILSDNTPIVIWGSPLRAAFEIMPFFLAGSLLRILPVTPTFRIDLTVFAVAIMITISIIRPQIYWCVNWFLVTYIVLSFGQYRTSIISRAGKWGDPSYGMYLYAFPIQQSLQYLTGNEMDLSGMILITTMLSMLMGYISWHIVERWFLLRSSRVKKRK